MSDPMDSDQSTTDLTELATARGLLQPHLRDFLIISYRSGHVTDDARNFYASAEFKEIIEILGRLGKGPGRMHHLLDVGCGNGAMSYAFARAGYAVTGIDISEGKLAGLQGARSLIGLDDVHFRVINGNMEALTMSDKFDVVFMRQALHHSSDPEATVQGLSRLLVPGGVFCAIREHVILNQRQFSQFLANHPFQAITQDEHAYTLSTYRSAFRKGGLVRRVELYPFDSDINFYPGSHTELIRYLSAKIHIDLKRHLRLRQMVLRLLAYKHQLQRDQLYSFFYQKPN